MKMRGIYCPTFGSRVVYEYSKTPLYEFEKDYINRFEEGLVGDSKFLGEGVTSKAYYSPYCDFVIKQNKVNPYIDEKTRWEMGSLAHEYEILSKISPNVKTTQRGIAYLETEKGGKFLLSTLVSGKPYDINSNPFTSKHIDRLLRNLYRLDKSQIIHSDLSRPNLLLDSNYNVNIIDYQWGDKYDLRFPLAEFMLRNSSFAPIEAPNNASMFESAALAGYSRKMPQEDLFPFLKSYYANKAHYVEKNVKRLQAFEQIVEDNLEYIRNITNFERAKLKAYGNIDPNIVDAEILKMNMLNLHRRQYSCYDPNKIESRNILRAIPLTLKAKECAEKLFNYTKGHVVDKEYYAGMRKIGEFWQRNMSSWYISALMNVFDIVSGRISDPAKVNFPEQYEKFTNLDVVEYDSSSKLVKYKNYDNILRRIFISASKKGYRAAAAERNQVFNILWRIFGCVR